MKAKLAYILPCSFEIPMRKKPAFIFFNHFFVSYLTFPNIQEVAVGLKFALDARKSEEEIIWR